MSAATNGAGPEGPAAGRFYARVWRWHFFAALVVIPFALWQAVTGTLYLWHRELAVAAHPELLRVEPGVARASLESQLRSVMQHHAGQRLTEVRLSDDPARSIAFMFTAANGLAYPAFTDPWTGRYLGAVSPAAWLPGTTRSLHGGWPLGSWGSYLLELGASWAIVMILSGIYLWWPRGSRSGLAGVLYPRLRSGSRVFWRDVHSTVGIWFAAIVLGFLFTALPWTTFWGGSVLGSVQRATGQTSPASTFFSGGGHHHAHQDRGAAAAERAPLDAFITNARQAGLNGPLEIRLGTGAGPVQIRTQTGRAFDDVYVQLDVTNAAVLSRSTWADWSFIPRVVALGVNLHEGTFFGRANQLFNTAVAASLVWLSVTGFIGWYRRRPAGGLAAPPRRAVHVPRFIFAVGGVLCVLLPLLGLSVLCLALADRALGRLLRPAPADALG